MMTSDNALLRTIPGRWGKAVYINKVSVINLIWIPIWLDSYNLKLFLRSGWKSYNSKTANIFIRRLLRNTPSLRTVSHLERKICLLFENFVMKYDHCMSGTRNAFMWAIQTRENKELLLPLKSPHKAEILPTLTSDPTVPVRAYLAEFLIQIRCPGHCRSVCGLIVHVKILQRRKWHPWIQRAGGRGQQKKSFCFLYVSQVTTGLLSSVEPL